MVQVELKFTGATMKEIREALISAGGDLLAYGLVSSPGGGLAVQGHSPNPSHVSQETRETATPPPSDLGVSTQHAVSVFSSAPELDNQSTHTLEVKKRGRKPKVSTPSEAPETAPAAVPPTPPIENQTVAAPAAVPPIAETIAAEAVTELTAEDALTALQKINDHFSAQIGIDEALKKSRELLGEFGVARVRELKDTQYAAFIARCKELSV